MKMQAYKIAIIGLGPKGLFAFARLLATLKASKLLDSVEIHLFEKSGNFGAGEIYNPSQPDYLLMNYPNRNINVWPVYNRESVVKGALPFSEWIAIRQSEDVELLYDKFSPRALVGQYLINCFEQLENCEIPAISLIKHESKVTQIIKCKGLHTVEYQDLHQTKIQAIDVNEILVTTGHCSWKGRLVNFKLSNSKRPSNFSDIPFVYPVNKKLVGIEENSIVAIKGLGLTFIDAVLALTEGRGGEFEQDSKKSLIYKPSGKEPNKIFAFSRSGLPMVPRTAKEGKTSHRPIYCTHKNIFRNLHDHQKPSFTDNVLPLFMLETKYRYYRVAFEKYNLSLYPNKNPEELECQIAEFHNVYPKEYVFHFEDLFKPVTLENPSSKLGSLAYLRYLIREAELGSEKSAFMAAAMTWAKLSEAFNRIYSFGGMTADSHWLFDKKYRAKLNRISYGPPVENMRKIKALMETGILNFDFAESPNIKKISDGWEISATGNYIKVKKLIDARIPSNRSVDDWSILLSDMRKSGIIREFLIKDESIYQTGCPEIDLSGSVIDAHGKPNPHIAFYGTPTEGITYDNDTLSRDRNNFASIWASQILRRSSALQLKK